MTLGALVAICTVIGTIVVLGRPALLLYRCLTRLDGMLTEWPSVTKRLSAIEKAVGVEPEGD